MSASTSRRRLITNQCRNHTETKRIHRVECAASAAGCKSMTAAECINKQREQRGIKTPNCCSDIACKQRPRPAQTPTHGDRDENRRSGQPSKDRAPINSTQAKSQPSPHTKATDAKITCAHKVHTDGPPAKRSRAKLTISKLNGQSWRPVALSHYSAVFGFEQKHVRGRYSKKAKNKKT